MTVRDPGYSPRPGAIDGPGEPPAGGPRPPRTARPSWLVPVLVVALVAGAGIGFGGGFIGGSLTGSGGGTATPAAVAEEPDPTDVAPSAGEPAESDDPASSGDLGAPSPATSPEPAPAAPVEADVAIVPVTNFRSGRATVKASEVARIASGEGAYDRLVLVEDDADAILATLGLDRGALGKELVLVASAQKLRAYLPKHRKALAFLRADDVDESVRALAWGGKALFGVARVKSLADWPLVARLPVAADATPYDPGRAWTMVAGGDILLDRGVALAIKDRGVNFPFDGGTVEITGICPDCSPFGWDLPYTKRTGDKGVVRDLVKGADISIANFENPAPDTFRFHGKGTVFTANPAYIKGLRNAGIDWLSLANNHIGDAGRAGMLQTIENVEK
ncbi:MAG TPA: CapA family protein, partial [Candidatus Limnocylindrales bacterium]|nr:CapA family protein [Candidatus Limnocylindrales bacterium]